MSLPKIYIIDDEQLASKSLATHIEIFFEDNASEIPESQTFEDPVVFFNKVISEEIKLQQTDIIIIDYMMPGLSGYELSKGLKDIYPNKPPMILFTANKEHIKQTESTEFESLQIPIFSKMERKELLAYISACFKGADLVA